MGRRKQYQRKQPVSFNIEHTDYERAKSIMTKSFKHKEIYLLGLRMARPDDISSCDFRLKQIEQEIQAIESDGMAEDLRHKSAMTEIQTKKFNLEVEQKALLETKGPMKEKEDKIFDEYVKAFPGLAQQCPAWVEGLDENIPFFTRHRMVMTYRTALKKLKERFGY